jgi:hypothetical protein
MPLLWLVTGASLVVALAAFARARRTAKRLEELTQNYWQLKYENGELRVQLQRLTGELTPPPPDTAPTRGRDSFVPLASLKR